MPRQLSNHDWVHSQIEGMKSACAWWNRVCDSRFLDGLALTPSAVPEGYHQWHFLWEKETPVRQGQSQQVFSPIALLVAWELRQLF